MTGIQLTPGEVKTVFRIRRKAGIRELFLDLLIREDLTETPPVTPETTRATLAAELTEK